MSILSGSKSTNIPPRDDGAPVNPDGKTSDNKPGLSVQAAIIGFGRLVNMAAAAGTLMMLARLLDREHYGAVCQVIFLYMLLSQIFAIGLPQSTYYFLPRYQGGEKRGFLYQTVLLLMLSGGLMGLGLLLSAHPLGRVLNSPLLPGLLQIFAIYPLFMLPALAVEGTLLNANRPLATVIFNACTRLGMLCGLVIPTLLGCTLTRTLETWMVIAGVMWAIALLLMFSTVRGLPFVWRRQMLRDEWKFSIPLALVTLITILASYVDRFFVSHFFGTAAFGIYSNATVEIPTVSMVTNATAVVLMAEFSRRTSVDEHGAIMPIWHSAMLKSAIVVFASLGFLAFWGTETMRILFSDKYAQSGGLFSIYVWLIPTAMLTTHALFISLGATRTLISVNLVGLPIQIVAMLICGHFFGLLGIPIAALISRYCVTVLGVHWYVRWLTKIGWRGFMPWRKMGLILLVALLAGGLSWLLKLLPHHVLPLLALYGVGLLVFGGAFIAGLARLGLLHEAIPARWKTLSLRPRQEVAV